MRQIAAMVGISHAAVHHRLKAAGITREQGTWIASTCSYCGVAFKRRRSQARHTKGSFCCAEHYYASRESDYVPWRHGQRLARAIVSQHFDLQPLHVVHHVDKDNRNNDLSNLEVYSQPGRSSTNAPRSQGRADLDRQGSKAVTSTSSPSTIPVRWPPLSKLSVTRASR